MTALVVAIVFTLVISAVCSLLEAMILSTTPTDIEALKKRDAARGAQLEAIREDIEDTISSILTLNTLANTLGAVLVGGLATRIFGEAWLGLISAVMAMAILICSEIIPKNVGVHYRRSLQPAAVPLLRLIRAALRPFTFLSNKLLEALLGGHREEEGEASSEILLMAEKGAEEGELDREEVNLISNALSLASVKVRELMTPRTVVATVPPGEKLRELLARMRTIRFGRMPVTERSPEEVVGVVRRRDILHAVASGEGDKLVRDLMIEPVFFPELATASSALETLLDGHQQMGIVVDEFGAFAGVITIEDIVEHLIGKEIYEKDDVAVDMRQLARLKGRLLGLHS
ncbi:MAG: hemolysin family protein [Terrimicrobiaceae bacterium]|nr:hemolysin family protein [Terrimicrobiaceae bacterium]